MKQIIFSIVFSIAAATVSPLSIQALRPSERERVTWMKEIQQYKNDFLIKKLALNDEQKTSFLPLYNSMEDEVRKVQEEAGQLYQQTMRKGDKATDLEYEKAAEAAYELKGRENEIEMKYFKDFKSILTPQQLFKLKDAERDFTRQLMRQHRRQQKR